MKFPRLSSTTIYIEQFSSFIKVSLAQASWCIWQLDFNPVMHTQGWTFWPCHEWKGRSRQACWKPLEPYLGWPKNFPSGTQYLDLSRYIVLLDTYSKVLLNWWLVPLVRYDAMRKKKPAYCKIVGTGSWIYVALMWNAIKLGCCLGSDPA